MTTALPLTNERADRWRDVQPPRRPHLLPAALTWVVIVVIAIVLTPEGGCSVQRPCGPDWTSALEETICLAAPVLLLWVPRLGVPCSLFAAGLFLYGERQVDLLPPWLVLGGPIAVLVATLAGQAAATRRERRVAALVATVPVATWPEPPPVLIGRPLGLLVGLALLACAPLLVAYGVVHGRTVAAAEAQAQQVKGTVVVHGDDGYLITVAVGDERLEFDTYLAADYPVGSTQLLLRSDEVDVLAAEPYDPSGWLGGAIALAALGSALGLRARDERMLVLGVLSGGQPVHQVLIGAGRRAEVLPVDGERTTPVVGLELVELGHPDRDAEMTWHSPDVEPGSDDLETESTSIRPGVLYGVPVAGRACAVLLDDGTSLVPYGRNRRGDADWRWVSVDLAVIDSDEDELKDLPEPDPLDQVELGAGVAARLRDRLLGTAQLMIGVVSPAPLAYFADGGWSATWRVAIAAQFAFSGALLLARGTRLTEAALVLDTLTRRTVLPWGALAGATMHDGDLLVRLRDGHVVSVDLPRGGPLRRGKRTQAALALGRVVQERIATTGRLRAEPASEQPRLVALAVSAAVVTSAVLGILLRGVL